MLINQLAAKYAEAIFEIAVEQGKEEQIFEQLKNVVKSIDDNQDLKQFIYNPGINTAAKVETVQKIFTGEVEETVLNFLMLLADRRREVLLPAIVEEYRKCAYKAHGIVEANVTSAGELSQAEQQALADKLSRICNKTVKLKIITDPSIIGGVVVQIGDKVIDGSVTRQLKTLKSVLLNNLDVKKIGVTN